MEKSDISVTSIVQAKFTSGEVVKSIHLNATIGNLGWTPENRILALVEHNNSVAFFIFISTKLPPVTFSDLTIERAIPIDTEFRCEIDSNNITSDLPFVLLNIVSTKLSFQLKVSQGTESSSFVAEVFRSVEGSSKDRRDFLWLQKYTCMRNGDSIDGLQNAGIDEDLDSPDIVVPRQKIAQGQVNVQARESLLRYQLALKVSDYTHFQEFTIFIGTWNVNGQAPTVPLSGWLSGDAEPPDVYAIGFQELDLSKEAFLFNDTPREEEWHQIYWLGDLNYRITELTAKQVKDHLNMGQIDACIQSDQLIQQHTKSRVFLGYTEGPISFQPTYKYDPGTDHFDTSEKARAPAWCDRILYKGNGINLSSYRSHPEIRISDHKPVSALFRAQIRVVDPVKYRKVHEEVLKKLDKLENEFLPQVMVDQTEVIFETVKFLEAQARDIIIANTGQVPVQFEFIKKLNDDSYCKDWLRITPYSGYIEPGEKCDIRLEVQLESPLEQLYDILVLHLDGGKDVFITVTGNCQRSCFTTAFSALCRTPVPMSHLAPEQLAHADSGRAPILYAVPRELWLLVDHLYRHGMRTQNLFDTHVLQSELIQVRDWLDNGNPDPLPTNIHAVAEALLLLLSFTAEPVIPYRLHQMCVAASSNYTSCKQIITTKLSELERNIFLYVCLFLQELLVYSSENGTDAKTLATVFGDILLRDPVRNSKPQANRGKASFVHHFLINDQSQLIAMRK